MKEQEVLFERLKEIKNYWVQTSVDGLKVDSDLIWTDYGNEYLHLQKILASYESQKAYMKVLDETIRGAIHSILVMLDGGDELIDKVNIDLINADTKVSLKKGISLHEEFLSYLIDRE